MPKVLKGHKMYLMEGNLTQSWPWKQNSTTVVVVVMILKVEEAC